MQWKALTAFGMTAFGKELKQAFADTTLASTICYCLNFQQGLKKNQNPRPNLISPIDIAGETKIYHPVCGN